MNYKQHWGVNIATDGIEYLYRKFVQIVIFITIDYMSEYLSKGILTLADITTSFLWILVETDMNINIIVVFTHIFGMFKNLHLDTKKRCYNNI